MNFKKLLLIILTSLPLQSNAMLSLMRPLALRMLRSNPRIGTSSFYKSMPSSPLALSDRKAIVSKGFSTLRSFSSMKHPKFFRFPKFRLILPATLGLTGLMLASHVQQAEPKKEAKPWAAVEERYRRELQAEEKQLMEEFFRLTNITQEEWDNERTKFKLSYLTNEKKLARAKKKSKSHPPTPLVANTIKFHLKQQGVNPQSIPLIRSDRGNFVAMTDQLSIWVNEKELKSSSLNFIHATILHEIEHIKNEDVTTRLLIRKLFNQKNVPWLPRWDFLNRHLIFCEKRADILAGVKNISYVQADQLHYCDSVFQERCDYTRKLHKEMMECAAKPLKAA